MGWFGIIVLLWFMKIKSNEDSKLNSLWSNDAILCHKSGSTFGPGNGLSLEQHQAIAWTIADLGMNLSEILIKLQ